MDHLRSFINLFPFSVMKHAILLNSSQEDTSDSQVRDKEGADLFCHVSIADEFIIGVRM